MKIKFLFFLLFCLQTMAGYSQQKVSLSGKLKMKPGTTIRFSRYKDLIGLERERLSTVKTGSDSSFTATFALQSAAIITISVNELFLEALFYPDRQYTFQLASTQNEHDGNLMMISEDPSANSQIKLTNAYNVFNDSTVTILFKNNNQRASKKEVDLFNAKINNALTQTKDPFCKELIQSKRVEYLLMSRAVNFSTTFNQYFDCGNLPMTNPAFQTLLFSTFSKYFNSGPPQITKLNFFHSISDSLHFADLIKILSVDPSMKCIPVREAVLLENVYELIKGGVISNSKGLSLLQEASQSASDQTIRKIAGDLFTALQVQQSGTAIPDFKLIYPDESIHSLAAFKKKPLHITLFSLKGGEDRLLIRQISDLAHLADSLGVANFLCITADSDREAVKKYWVEKKYPMQLCFAPDDYEMIDFFNAYTNPSFVLLNSKGQIFTLAPNFPGDQLLKQLTSLYKADNPSQPEVKGQQRPQRPQDGQFLPGSPPKASRK